MGLENGPLKVPQLPSHVIYHRAVWAKRPVERQLPCSQVHTATIFTSFFGRTMTFLIVLPIKNGFTCSEALAAASKSAWEALAETLITSRSLPLTWTGISSVSSTSRRSEERRVG